MIHPPLRIRPLPLRIWRLRIVDGCGGRLKGYVGPGTVVESAKSFCREEGYSAEETAAFILVEDVYYFFAVGVLGFML